ncbi:hypothetical protein N7463_010884 [Penicillium fimorum]|uniref:Uncharacterized protein n=1 Tax=Penicillium fimorum TaxID=1882269 RepID=A0A9X0C1Q2_9EURO|nr:hypothetical protein N7463_010884 [Penicillium fimorum]
MTLNSAGPKAAERKQAGSRRGQQAYISRKIALFGLNRYKLRGKKGTQFGYLGDLLGTDGCLAHPEQTM